MIFKSIYYSYNITGSTSHSCFCRNNFFSILKITKLEFRSIGLTILSIENKMLAKP